MNRKLFLLTLCFVIVLVAILFAHNVVPGITKGTQREMNASDTELDPVSYHPAIRQTIALFVEDPGYPLFGPATKPDPLWDTTLTHIVGTGNFGWFGPTTTTTQDGPDLATMQGYYIVIWNCYDYWWGAPQGEPPSLTSTDQTNIQDYISGGGKVWLLGHDILWSGVPYTWMDANFHLAGAVEDYVTDSMTIDLHGLAEIDSISFTANCDYQSNGFWPDNLTPDDTAHHILEDLTYNKNPCIASPNTTPLSTSFWTVDGRGPNPVADWELMVHDLLDAFGVLVGVEEKPGKTIDLVFGLLQNTPNPFRDGKAAISYTTTCSGPIGLKIYDSSGRLIMTLLDRPNENAGSKTVYWDGRDNNNHPVATGVYFYRLTAQNRTATKKMVVVR